MPGGLDAVRDVVGQFHRRGVKVFLSYNPWDTGTRREGVGDEVALAELIARIEADGIFLDTMARPPVTLRQEVDRRRPGVAFEPEGSTSLGAHGVAERLVGAVVQAVSRASACCG